MGEVEKKNKKGDEEDMAKKEKMVEKVEESKKPLTFEKFYCPCYSVEQNAKVLWKILKSERYAHFLEKKDLEKIKTEEELKEKYDHITSGASNLVINEEKIKKALGLLAQAAGRKRKKYSRECIYPSFYFYSIVIRLKYNEGGISLQKIIKKESSVPKLRSLLYY